MAGGQKGLEGLEGLEGGKGGGGRHFGGGKDVHAEVQLGLEILHILLHKQLDIILESETRTT